MPKTPSKEMKISDDLAHELFMNQEGGGFSLIEEGDWVSDGKYEICEIIYEKDGKFWEMEVSRSGSAFSEWHYEPDTDLVEVEKKEITISSWVPVDST